MRVAGIVLAAGASTRMGRNKMLVEIEGETLVHRAARRALAAGLDPVVVVVGHEAEAVREAVGDLAVSFAMSDPAAPNHVSAHAGTRDLDIDIDIDIDAAIVILADMPAVDEAMLRAVRDAEGDVVASRYGETIAPPMRFSRALFDDLATRSGRAVAEEHGATLLDWPPDNLADVDRPTDLPSD